MESRMKITSNIDLVVGLRLRKRRIACEIDTATLAQRAGQTESQIVAYESGTARLNARVMLEICHELRINVRYLFEPLTKNSRQATAPAGRIAATLLIAGDTPSLSR
jgi:transcriptional regulator with XRE-family HTH domain